jgi:hypothetical protein
MFDFLNLFSPTTGQALGSLAAFLTALALAGLGSMSVGRWRLNEADLMTGTGIAITAFTMLGAIGILPLSWIGYVILGLGMGGLCWRTLTDGQVGGPGAGKAVILMLPLLVLIAGMRASQWDEFSQWLHSSLYLLQHDSFPREGLPASRASYPAYPYGLADLSLLVGLISRSFEENAVILFNVFLTAAFGLTLIRTAELAGGPSRPEHRGWGLAAMAIIAGILTFPVQKILLSNYADAATALLLGAAGACGWRMIEAMERGAEKRAFAPAMQYGWIMAGMIGLKQANLVLFVVLTIATLFTGLVTSAVRARSLFRNALFMVLPAAAVFIVWRAYVDLHLPGAAEFTITDPARWVFHLAPDILAKMLEIAAKKGVYFGIMLVIVILGVRGLLMRKSPLDRLALIVGLTFLGYNAFLYLTYLMAFGEYEARNAASYWRYNMHLFGLAALPVAWIIGSWASDRFAAGGRMIAAILATALVIAIPFGLASKIRFDSHPVKDFVRDITAELRGTLPAGTRLMVIDPLMTVFYGLVINYDLTNTAEVGGYIHIRNPQVKFMTLYEERFRPTHIIVHTSTEEVDRYTGLELDRQAAHLLTRDGDEWRIVKSWPYPGYTSPTEFKH